MARYYAKPVTVREIGTHNTTSFDPACLKPPNLTNRHQTPSTPSYKTPNRSGVNAVRKVPDLRYQLPNERRHSKETDPGKSLPGELPLPIYC